MLLVPYAHAGVCCICVSYAVGMDTDGAPASAQLAHYVEHIVATFSAADSTRLEALAVAHNASTDGDITSYYAAGATESVCGAWLPVLARAVRGPDVRDDRLVKEARAVVTELRIVASDPAVRLAECISRIEAPHSHETSIVQQLAYAQVLASYPAVARRDVLRLMAMHYSARRAHVTIVAHVDSHAHIAARVALHFGHDPSVVRARVTARVSGFPYGREHVAYRDDVETAHVSFRVAIPDASSTYPAWASARIMAVSAQRLLRETLGSVYHTGVRPVFFSRNDGERRSGRYRAWMEVSCQCAHDHVRAVTELVRTRVFDAHVTDADVVSWKATERMGLYTRPEPIMDTAQRCGRADMLGLPALSAPELVAALERVSADSTTAMNAAVATMCCTGVVAAFSANAVVSASLTPKTVDLLYATTQGLIATKDALLAQPEAAA